MCLIYAKEKQVKQFVLILQNNKHFTNLITH